MYLPCAVTPAVVVLVEPTSAGSSAPEMIIGPISRVMAVLVILVTLLALITLVASSASLCNPGTTTTRLTGLKMVSATIGHRVR